MEQIPTVAEPRMYRESAFVDSGFIEIISDKRFDVQMKYPFLKMKNAEQGCYVRKEVYEMLCNAAEMLPVGMRLRIWDAWRPFALQQELYTEYADDIIREFELQNCSEEQQKAVIRKFVSEPIEEKDVPPVHTTGGAVDVTILDSNGNELEMGSGFDEFSDRTYTAYYENSKDERIRKNRRLLYGVMTKAGFSNLPSEWWHYDYGNRFWAYYNNQPAIYRGVCTKEEALWNGLILEEKSHLER